MNATSKESWSRFAKIQAIELQARILAQACQSGTYKSAFKGSGLDFDDYREYQEGDEIRFIDWNATARTGTTYIRTFKEEKELPIYILLDVSASNLYGSGSQSKLDLMTEIAATLAFSSIHNANRVGLILFADRPLKSIPPASGRSQALRIIQEIVSMKPSQSPTDLDALCSYVNQRCPSHSLLFLLSDFIDIPLGPVLASTAVRHDLVALQVEDAVEKVLPKAGRLILNDPETNQQVTINTNNLKVRDSYAKKQQCITAERKAYFLKHAIDHATFQTEEDYFPHLHSLLSSRSTTR